MFNKKYLYYILIILLVVTVTTFSIVFFSSNNKDKLIYASGQIGLLTNSETININNQDYQTHQTTNEKVYLYYETFNMNEAYDNYILINDTHKINIIPSALTQNSYVENITEILSANITNNKLDVSFNVGKDIREIKDTFWIKNVYLKIKDEIIFPKETQSNQFESVYKVGSFDLKSDQREDYLENYSFTFEINKKFIKTRGVILETDSEEIIINNKTHLDNPIYLKIDINISNNEVIENTKVIKVETTLNSKTLEILLNGVKINNNLKLNSDAWAIGNNELEVIASNEYGFIKKKTINFVLSNKNINYQTLSFKAYDYGINKLDDKTTKGSLINNPINFKTNFSEDSHIMFVVEKSDNKALLWEGKSLPNRTVYLELYNFENNTWETKSSMKVIDKDEIITLGYNYEDENEYLNNDEIYVRVVSKNTNKLPLIDKYIYHATDIQYMVMNGIVEATHMANIAKTSLTEMTNHMINLYDEGLLEYIAMTGDFVQRTNGKNDEQLKEWPLMMEYFMNPLLDKGIPLGVVSGNHDIGALNENPNRKDGEIGIDLFDEDLIYDYFYDNLGENVFKDNSYYGGSFLNNRSHYDLINIMGHDFLFLYLGWGSSIKGIHVSELDINFAKEVLELYPNHTVVIGVHEYMGNKGLRSQTGNYLFNELVKKYSNIKFVLSGHINGTSGLIDYLDDDNDGYYDRRVLQLLTNFQEEGGINNLGASFIRRIGLDYTNNQMIFDLYSPVMNDYQIFVGANPLYVKKYTYFTYDFDLENNDYGLLTLGFGE